jgi:hypothetical protein
MDNFYLSCPPKMEDGRSFTDYRTPTRREEYIKYTNKILRNDDHRLFYQQNARKIMDEEWDYLKRTENCVVNGYVHDYPTRVHPINFIHEKHNYNELIKTLVSLNKSKLVNPKVMQDFRL